MDNIKVIEKNNLYNILNLTNSWSHCQIITGKVLDLHCKKRFFSTPEIISNLLKIKSVLLYEEDFILNNKTKKIKIEISLDEMNQSKACSSSFVYFLIKNNKIIYIGSVHKDLSQRIYTHINGKGSLIQPKDFDFIFYDKIDKENVDIVERANIFKYQPILNKEEKPNIFHDGIDNIIKMINNQSVYLSNVILK